MKKYFPITYEIRNSETKNTLFKGTAEEVAKYLRDTYGIVLVAVGADLKGEA